MAHKIDLTKQINYLTRSSTTNMQSIFVSILLTNDYTYIKQKFTELRQLIKLTDIEKQIIKEIDTSIEISGVVNTNYLVNKFSYYFEAASVVEIPKDQIDFAIMDRKIHEERTVLSKELLALANEIDNLTSTELKQKLRELTEQKLITAEHLELPDNSLSKKEDAYADLIEDNGIYSLLLREVEAHSGKAGIGHVISLLAFVGSFKSTYALNMAYDNALKGHNVLFLSLESTAKAMESRMVINHIATTAKQRKDLIPQKEIREGNLTKEQAKYYNEKHNEMVDLIGDHFILWDSVDVNYGTFLEMTQTLRAADAKFKEKTGRGLEILVLDQLALLKHTDPTGTGKRYSYAGAIMDEWMTYFRQQSLNFLGEGRQMTSVIVSQVRREAYADASKPKNKGRYDASAGGDSNEIERTSDTIITLYKDLDTKNTLLVHIPKSRHGSTPDKPIQVEVYGDYFHVGALDNLDGSTITAESFERKDFSLADLLKGGK